MTKEKNLKVYIPLALVIIAVMAAGVVWYNDYTKYITTDDAHVESDNVSVSPKILGRIKQTYVEEGDSVKAGMLLAELDSTDLSAQKQQAIAGKAQTEAAKAQAEAKLGLDEKTVKVLQVAVDRAQEDFDRAKNQFSGEVISKEQYDHAQKSLESAQAQLSAAQSQLTVSRAQINSAEKAIESADAQIDVISTQINNTKLYASINGVVAKRWLLIGDVAQAGQSIFTLNNNTKFWVIIYLEETKIGKLKIGQSAIFNVDAYPDVVFMGKIFSLGSSTAAVFSLMPASNASGNFTKVTQRVSLKISIDGIVSGESLSNYRLLNGMSSIVKIIK